jgi:hypothetical protein
MSSQRILEEYLLDLEDALSPLTTMERAQAMQELHGQIVDEIERQGGADQIRTVLKHLGSPEDQAKRYMVRKGLNYSVPQKKTSPFKVFALGVLGLASVTTILVIIFVRSFLPIVEVDEKTGQVKLFGGAIVADENSGNFTVSGNVISYSSDDDDDDSVAGMFGGKSRTIFSSMPLTDFDGLQLVGNAGVFELETGDDGILSYRCQTAVSANQSDIQLRQEERQLVLDFSALPKLKCKINIPPQVALSAEFSSGKVALDELRQSTRVKLGNGVLTFEPDSTEEYKLSASVQNGLVKGANAAYLSSENPEAHQVELSVTNGTIVIR